MNVAEPKNRIAVIKKTKPGWWASVGAFLKGETVEEVSASRSDNGLWRNVFGAAFGGEKDFGELGPAKLYFMNFPLLSIRSWQSIIDSELSETIIGAYVKWVIGKGLRLQAEPEFGILKEAGINVDKMNFSRSVESRWKMWAGSSTSTHKRKQSYDQQSREEFKNAVVGGDVLVVLRLEKGNVTVEIIDTLHLGHNSLTDPKTKNRIDNGVEIDKSGRHIAFHVRKNHANPHNISIDYERIPAREPKTGIEMAFLVYGRRYRIDDQRGIPMITSIMQSLKKLERYREAVIGSAEERQKVTYQVVHDNSSTGEDPRSQQKAKLTRGFSIGTSDGKIPEDDRGNLLADKVAATTGKQTYNMPIGSKLEQLASTNEMHFDQFYSPNVNIICSAVGIPPEVAMQKYDSNFSASRAALKDWEHTLNVRRDAVIHESHKKVYKFWFTVQVLASKISAPGYLKAMQENDQDIIEAYLSCRFTGQKVPHIDPVKEVKAERMKLGGLAKDIPLTTVSQATENLGDGEFDQNIDRYKEELLAAVDIISRANEVSSPQSANEE